LRGLGASIAPIVDAESHGVVLRGPRENAFALVELGLTCGLTPSLERADLVEARLSAIARVDAIEAVAAGALAPNAPGHIAPGGTVGTIQSVSAAALRRELEASRVGARASVAVVGAVDVEAVVPRIARRLAALAAGTLPSPRPTVDPEASEIIAFEADGSMPRVIVSFLIRDPTPPSVVAASAFAAEIARALSATRGITLVGVRAGEIQNASWLAVAVDVDVAHLDTMPERVRIAVERAKQQPLDTVLARARSETRWAEAEPAVVVMRLSRERLFGPTASRDESDFMGLGEPIFAIGHPR
jgi:hypothetical protein